MSGYHTGARHMTGKWERYRGKSFAGPDGTEFSFNPDSSDANIDPNSDDDPGYYCAIPIGDLEAFCEWYLAEIKPHSPGQKGNP